MLEITLRKPMETREELDFESSSFKLQNPQWREERERGTDFEDFGVD